MKKQVSVPTGPELLVLVPEITGAPTFQINRFQINRFRTYDDAAAFVRTSVPPELLSSTHIFWAMHEGPPAGADPAGGEALVLIRAGGDRELVHIVSFVDLEAAAAFARNQVKRGLDLASMMIYWAAFSPLAEELAGSVMASASEGPTAQEDGPEPPHGAEPGFSGKLDKSEERSGSGSKRRWALLPVAGLLLFIGGVCFLRPGSDGSGDEVGSVDPAVQSQEDLVPTPSPAGTPTPEVGDVAPAPAPTTNTGSGGTDASTPPPPTATPKPTSAPSGPVATVSDISYSTTGGRTEDLHVTVAISVVDDRGQPVAGASVSADIKVDGSVYISRSGATGTDGRVLLKVNGAPSGCYVTLVTAVDAPGLVWDGSYADPGFAKDTVC